MVLVSPLMWPDTTETAPNSPIALALHKRTPESRAHFTDVRKRHAAEDLPATGAQRGRRFLRVAPCSCISGTRVRATKGKVTKTVARTNPGKAKMIWMSRLQPFAEPAMRAEQQHPDEARR
jgi:hypothetical protein